MPEIQQFNFSLKEIAEILIRQQDLHEGLWGIYVEFGFGATNINTTPEPGSNMLPAAIVSVSKLGLQRFPEPSNLTVDAAEVNPLPSSRTSASRKHTQK